MMDLSFYRGKKILITGHTGFKGSWMSQLLLREGAEVYGYAKQPPTDPSMFGLCGLKTEMESIEGDVRDLDTLRSVFLRVKPEFVVHMAAQPIVRESYRNPVETYETNVMGTVNVLECICQTDSVNSFLNVTTDKVYKNREWEWGYRENEELNGYDPYSNSKSCSELVTDSYRNSFFGDSGLRVLPITTARAGNVIGGGDFAADRIIPDCVRAVSSGEKIRVRNPYSVRPYQHVLEPVAAYLMILKRQWEQPELAGCYNVGPDEADCWETGRITTEFCKAWKNHTGKEADWIDLGKEENIKQPHEANFLKLDCTRLKRTFDWTPSWTAKMAVERTVEWYAEYVQGKNVRDCTERQIEAFLREKR